MRRAMLGAILAVVAACSSSSMTAPYVATASVLDYQFTPSTITIKAGESVRWTNIGTVQHTVTSDSAGLFNSALAAPGGGGGGYGGGNTNGGFLVHAFADAGTFTYHCTNHPAMTGTVIVTP